MKVSTPPPVARAERPSGGLCRLLLPACDFPWPAQGVNCPAAQPFLPFLPRPRGTTRARATRSSPSAWSRHPAWSPPSPISGEAELEAQLPPPRLPSVLEWEPHERTPPHTHAGPGASLGGRLGCCRQSALPQRAPCPWTPSGAKATSPQGGSASAWASFSDQRFLGL